MGTLFSKDIPVPVLVHKVCTLSALAQFHIPVVFILAPTGVWLCQGGGSSLEECCVCLELVALTDVCDRGVRVEVARWRSAACAWSAGLTWSCPVPTPTVPSVYSSGTSTTRPAPSAGQSAGVVWSRSSVIWFVVYVLKGGGGEGGRLLVVLYATKGMW